MKLRNLVNQSISKNTVEKDTSLEITSSNDIILEDVKQSEIELQVDSSKDDIKKDSKLNISDVEITLSSEEIQEIRELFLYFDDLLENLPEEYIMDFAKSDKFVTYKKVFSILKINN